MTVAEPSNIKDLERRVVDLEIARVSIEKDVKWLQDNLALRFKASDDALVLSSKETQRRLDALNGEAERLRQMQATYLPREVWEQAQKEVTATMVALRESRSEGGGRRQAQSDDRQQSNWKIGVIVSVVLAALAIIVAIVEAKK